MNAVNVWLLGGVLIVALALLAWSLNHVLARLAWLEIALSSGLPQETTVHRDAGSGQVSRVFSRDAAAKELPDGLTIFASTSCITCTRIVDELGAEDVTLDEPLLILFSGAKPQIPIELDYQTGRQDTFDQLGIPATPYGVVIVDGKVASHGTMPDPQRVQSLLVTAGSRTRLPVRLLADFHAQDADASAQVTS